MNNRKGEAMIMVIGIMFFFMALSLAILLAASSQTGSVKQTAVAIRCKMAAVTFSQVLGEELTDSKQTDTEDRSGQIIRSMLEGDAGLSYCITQDGKSNSWVYRPKGISGKSLPDEMNGYDICVRMYWGDEEKSREEIAEQLANGSDENKYNNLYLYTEVTCIKDKSEWTVRQSYQITQAADNFLYRLQ